MVLREPEFDEEAKTMLKLMVEGVWCRVVGAGVRRRMAGEATVDQRRKDWRWQTLCKVCKVMVMARMRRSFDGQS